MDLETIKKYDDETEAYLTDWMPQTPRALRDLLVRWFTPGSTVLDVGSGGGRDVQWMAKQGFKPEGVDASKGLLDAARRRCPGLVFRFDPLPELLNTPDQSFDNILCSAVLMHLPAEKMASAVSNLMRVTKPGGRIICSVRPSREPSTREADGRLYTPIGIDGLADLFIKCGGRILLRQTSDSEKGDRTWHTVVVEKPGT